MNETIKCPYCEYENSNPGPPEILGMLDEDNNCDVECGNCEKEFSIYAEINVIYHVSKIEYTPCEHCKQKTREIKYKDNTFPFPKSLGHLKVCMDCYGKYMITELNGEHEQ